MIDAAKYTSAKVDPIARSTFEVFVCLFFVFCFLLLFFSIFLFFCVFHGDFFCFFLLLFCFFPREYDFAVPAYADYYFLC